MELLILIGVLGLVCGLLSGLLGIGGGIIMAPLLLFVPPLFGFAELPMQVVAGLTIVQGLVACMAGVCAHYQANQVSKHLAGWMGGAIFVASLVGGAAAGWVDNHVLLFIFGGLAIVASVLMFSPGKVTEEVPGAIGLEFSRYRAVSMAGGVGLLGGLVGQGGSFILIPLMTSFLKIPTRVAMGSNLAIVLLSTAAAFIGKAITGQIEWLLAVPIVLTVIPGSYIGGCMSGRVPVLVLRRLLAIFIALAAGRILISLFSI